MLVRSIEVHRQRRAAVAARQRVVLVGTRPVRGRLHLPILDLRLVPEGDELVRTLALDDGRHAAVASGIDELDGAPFLPVAHRVRPFGKNAAPVTEARIVPEDAPHFLARRGYVDGVMQLSQGCPWTRF